MSKCVRGFVASFFLMLVAAFADAEAINISTGDYPPWTIENSTTGGYVNRVVRQAFERNGINVHFVYMPWKRAYEEMRALRFNASSFWFYNEKRIEEFHQVGPVSEHHGVFFRLKSNPVPNWSSFADLKSFRIGATIGFTYSGAFWEAARNGVFSIEETTHDDINFRKLLRKRIDLFPIDEMTGRHFAGTI